MATSRKQAAAAATTAGYEVISPLDHDGEHYAVGETVDLTEAQAAPLLGNTVKLAPDAAKKAE